MFLGGAKPVLGGAKPPKIFRAPREKNELRAVLSEHIFKLPPPGQNPVYAPVNTPIWKIISNL